jgi:hypothetical protein
MKSGDDDSQLSRFDLLVPQGTTRHETKGDVVFSTIFPKSFPKRNLMMCIPV